MDNDFENLIVTYEKDLYSFCCHLTAGSGVNAGDLYQDTVLAAFEKRAQIDFTRNPKSFLFSIAVGKWKNAWRKAKRRQEKDAMSEDTAESDNPETMVQSSFTREAIRTALVALHDKLRIPLILYYFEDRNLDIIASICNIPKGTVKSRLHKGRALLKAALEKEGF
ncbi:MAG: RNA polymerase sigma factor [Defluviitaleaceae bacterium]|nr:RNA polymerase sigma factor [Defluviitaleaceae bacterium]